MNREPWIDILRGIGILLVVLGHTTNLPAPAQAFIYSFHLPLFFFLSGYLFHSEKYKGRSHFEFALLRFRRLMVPYFVIALICLMFVLLKDLKNNVFEFKVLLRYVEGILYSRGSVHSMPSCSPLWFLSCLYVIELFFFLIIKTFSKPMYIFFAVVVLGLVGALLSTGDLQKFFWNSDTALTGIVFYYCGYLVRNSGGIEKLLKPYYLLVFLVLNAFFVKFNPIAYVDFDGNRFGNIFMMYLGAFAGIGAAINLSKIIAVANLSKLQDFLVFWGKNTLPVIGFDYLTLNLLNALLIRLHLEQLYVLNFLVHLITLFVVIRVLRLNHLIHRLVYGLI